MYQQTRAAQKERKAKPAKAKAGAGCFRKTQCHAQLTKQGSISTSTRINAAADTTHSGFLEVFHQKPESPRYITIAWLALAAYSTWNTQLFALHCTGISPPLSITTKHLFILTNSGYRDGEGAFNGFCGDGFSFLCSFYHQRGWMGLGKGGISRSNER
jgi:hypothetical protein